MNKPIYPADATEKEKQRINQEFKADADWKRKNKPEDKFPTAHA